MKWHLKTPQVSSEGGAKKSITLELCVRACTTDAQALGEVQAYLRKNLKYLPKVGWAHAHKRAFLKHFKVALFACMGMDRNFVQTSRYLIQQVATFRFKEPIREQLFASLFEFYSKLHHPLALELIEKRYVNPWGIAMELEDYYDKKLWRRSHYTALHVAAEFDYLDLFEYLRADPKFAFYIKRAVHPKSHDVPLFYTTYEDGLQVFSAIIQYLGLEADNQKEPLIKMLCDPGVGKNKTSVLQNVVRRCDLKIWKYLEKLLPENVLLEQVNYATLRANLRIAYTNPEAHIGWGRDPSQGRIGEFLEYLVQKKDFAIPVEQKDGVLSRLRIFMRDLYVEQPYDALLLLVLSSPELRLIELFLEHNGQYKAQCDDPTFVVYALQRAAGHDVVYGGNVLSLFFDMLTPPQKEQVLRLFEQSESVDLKAKGHSSGSVAAFRYTERVEKLNILLRRFLQAKLEQWDLEALTQKNVVESTVARRL